ncbi:carbohydrate-binding module family 13 protein [Suillus ampliporus]|nr:carbohydrate-binding module family 13 protein [Suillus ampliporus]
MSYIHNNQKYTLINCQKGFALDLSCGDSYSIIGHNVHSGLNQTWIFWRIDEEGWLIKSASSDKWLGIQGNPRNIKETTKVIAVPSPFKWKVEDSDIPGVEGIRISAHGTNFSVDMYKNANTKEDGDVHLWGKHHGANQIWAVVPR